MQLKIGDVWYHSSRQPLLVRFTAEEMEELGIKDGTICCFPEGTPEEKIKAFIGDINARFRSCPL